MLSVVIRLIRAFAKAPMCSGTRLLVPTRMTDTGSRNRELVKICGKVAVEAFLAVKEMEKLSNCLRNRDSAVLKAHQ